MYNGDIYLQTDRVVMGSFLGLVLTRIFIINLDRSLFPVLKYELSFWKRYLDDNFSQNWVCRIHIINFSFHPNIEFTCATENNPKLALLDVLLFRERVL